MSLWYFIWARRKACVAYSIPIHLNYNFLNMFILSFPKKNDLFCMDSTISSPATIQNSQIEPDEGILANDVYFFIHFFLIIDYNKITGLHSWEYISFLTRLFFNISVEHATYREIGLRKQRIRKEKRFSQQWKLSFVWLLESSRARSQIYHSDHKQLHKMGEPQVPWLTRLLFPIHEHCNK